MTGSLADLDVSLAVLEADITLLDAAYRTHSPSDRAAYRLDMRLIRTKAQVATDDDYPGWAEQIAAIEELNDKTRKEARR